jgi:hypothetical protein
LEVGFVVENLLRKIQGLSALSCHRLANQASAITHHLVDEFRCTLVRGEDEVSFVLAVVIVHQDDHSPKADLLDGFFNGRSHGGMLWRLDIL